MLLQRVTSQRSRAQSNAPAASYWSRDILDDDRLCCQMTLGKIEFWGPRSCVKPSRTVVR